MPPKTSSKTSFGKHSRVDRYVMDNLPIANKVDTVELKVLGCPYFGGRVLFSCTSSHE